MHPFSRAYRDLKSPLTPLTPLETNTAFRFDITGDDTLKPFMEALESERGKENSTLTPVGMIPPVKCVNPSKYMKPAHGAESTVDTKKLSPRFVSTKKPKSEVINFNKSHSHHSVSDKSSNFMKANTSKRSPKYEPTNSSSFKEASDASSYNSNSSCWKSCSSQSDTSRRRDSSAYNSAYSSDSRSSFNSSLSESSTSSTCGASAKQKDTNRRIPPKLFINETKEDNGATMSSIFGWVWNQLSPIHNLTIYELLTHVGMQKYWELFKREEIIDLDVFSTLTIKDLKTIGIKNSNDCVKILESVRMALDFLSGLLVLKKP